MSFDVRAQCKTTHWYNPGIPERKCPVTTRDTRDSLGYFTAYWVPRACRRRYTAGLLGILWYNNMLGLRPSVFPLPRCIIGGIITPRFFQILFLQISSPCWVYRRGFPGRGLSNTWTSRSLDIMTICAVWRPYNRINYAWRRKNPSSVVYVSFVIKH